MAGNDVIMFADTFIGRYKARTTVVRGAPAVEPNNKYFWFNRSHWILLLIHFTLFQMGSRMKKTIFEEQTAKNLRKWQKAAREKWKIRKAGGAADVTYPSSGYMSGETTPSQGTSPLHLLHEYKTSSSCPAAIESIPYSPRSCQSDTEFSETEGSAYELKESRPSDQCPRKLGTAHDIDFSFVKS